MTKEQLKKIIKECLVEILMEGMGETLTESMARAPQRQVRSSARQHMQQPPPPPQRRSTLYDNMRVGPQQQVSEAIKQTTRDPILASILADTAQTTLLHQDSPRQAAAPAGGGMAERVVAAYEPTDIFGEEQAQRWAEAAFAPRQHLPGFGGALDYDPYAPVKKA